MPDFGRLELVDIAADASELLLMELRLFGIDGQTPTITGGMVRVVAEALNNAGYLVMWKRDALYMPGEGFHRPESPPPTGDPERGFFGGPLPTADELDAWGNPRETGEPPAIAEPPAPEIADGSHEIALEGSATLSEAAAPEIAEPPTPADGWNDEQRALYGRATEVIRGIARNGQMPTLAAFNAEKPQSLPSAQYLCKQLGCKWSEIAELLGLRLMGPGGHPVVGNPLGAHEAAPLPDTPPKSAPALRGERVGQGKVLIESAPRLRGVKVG